MADQELSTAKSGGHTPEPCYREDDWIIGNGDRHLFRFILSGFAVSGLSLNDVLAFMDRMVRATNACRGLTAEQVEAIPGLIGTPEFRAAFDAKLAAFEAMREALGYALERLELTTPKTGGHVKAAKKARAALTLADEAAKLGVAT